MVTTNNHAILVDAGPPTMGDSLVRYLRRHSVSHLDFVIATHPHADHIGGLSTLFAEKSVDTLLCAYHPHTTQTYENYVAAAKHAHIPRVAARRGDSYHRENLHIEILHPDTLWGSLNNGSVVARLSIGAHTMLLTGDAEKEVEEELLKHTPDALYAPVLKVGHHGSNSSSTHEFLAAVAPRIALIQCGKNSPYGHPHPRALRRIHATGADIFSTAQHGSIRLKGVPHNRWRLIPEHPYPPLEPLP
ncbi:metallo-beta-lactamase [Chitinivibrio alkaliphilus ACht1]|uniref:Metallo-beta-lactamase n=1 Tax=Chitinivibrio alkaliphilus ACht1 TaxID=1313304 RepID=U7DB36_9BACT|nr:metallo-beta-lactamase [Chitinivibrio alkaliphilus ACht1]